MAFRVIMSGPALEALKACLAISVSDAIIHKGINASQSAVISLLVMHYANDPAITGARRK